MGISDQIYSTNSGYIMTQPGFTVDFEQELSNLLHGFYQIIAVENHYGLGEICEGKDP